MYCAASVARNAIAFGAEVRSLIDEHHRLKVEFGRLFRECLRVIDEYQMRKPTDIRRKSFTFLLAETTEMSKHFGKMSQQNAFLLAETTEMSKQTG